MSGSGGGGYSGGNTEGSGSIGGGGGGGTPMSCDTLVINTQIATPNPAFVGNIHVDDECSVELVAMHGQQVIVIVREGAEQLGGLSGGATARLRECLLAGTSYRATVTEVNGPQIKVRIRPA